MISKEYYNFYLTEDIEGGIVGQIICGKFTVKYDKKLTFGVKGAFTVSTTIFKYSDKGIVNLSFGGPRFFFSGFL